MVTAGNAGPSANATLTYSGTFTVPYITYDAYGRVTGRTNMTMTMPAAPSGGTATALSYKYATNSKNFAVPSGGTWIVWRCWEALLSEGSRYDYITRISKQSGGSTISGSFEEVCAIRVA